MASAYLKIGLLPTLMGLGHLAPALGAVRAVTGSYDVPVAVFGMIWSASTLVDSYDKYKDTVKQERPHHLIWRFWIYSLWTAVLVCTYYSGLDTAIMMYRFSAIGLSWATPCIPIFSSFREMGLHKPKTVLRETKSLIAAICMGSVTAGTTTFHVCNQEGGMCSGSQHRPSLLYLAILYQFLRETACDTRDILEDTEAGMLTLPVRLGRRNTMLFLAFLAVVVDAICTGAYSVDGPYHRLHGRLFGQTCLRVIITITFHAIILRYPKRNSLAWGAMSLLGLLPVMWAQLAAMDDS